MPDVNEEADVLLIESHRFNFRKYLFPSRLKSKQQQYNFMLSGVDINLYEIHLGPNIKINLCVRNACS